MSQIDIQQINGLPFGRAYKITDKDVVKYLPSVTTILKLNEDPFIQHLRDELGDEKFEELRDNGAARGTVMHRWLEIFMIKYAESYNAVDSLIHTQKYIVNCNDFIDLPNLPKALKSGRNLFYNFYNNEFYNGISEVLHNEIFLYTLFRGGWAGTCDFVYKDINQKLVILDYKSSSIPKDVDHLDNYKMQISCYMFMYSELYGIIPDRGEILISNELNSNIQLVTVYYRSADGLDMKYYLKMFLELLKTFRLSLEWQAFYKTIA